MSRRWLALWVSVGLLCGAAEAYTVNPPQPTVLSYICDTAEAAETVGLRPADGWSSNLPYGCMLIGEQGSNARIDNHAYIHEIIKILRAFEVGHFAVGLVYIPHNNRWGFSTGRIALLIS